jgi:CelD/BcsL family acetyltransferase involved in cellulose biosynthesis
MDRGRETAGAAMTARGTALEVPLGANRARAASAAAFARVDVHREADAAVLDAWGELEAIAPCSVYQTRAWLLPWAETLGRGAGLAPVFVIARAADGAPLVLLCLGVRRRGLARIATFLGGKDSNVNLPLIRPGVALDARDWRQLLSCAARQLGRHAPDAFLFANQPHDWAGVANSLAVLPWRPSPSAAVAARLAPRAEDFFLRALSREARKKLRRKAARLAELGPLAHRVAATPAERAAVLDAFFTQKIERLRALNIASDFDDPRMRRFIEAASEGGPRGAGIELHALYTGERIVAVYGGAAHAGHWSGMFNSFDPDPAVARSSPGDLLLMAVIDAQCAAGRQRVDLGIGEARYKAAFCGETIALFDTFAPITAKGAAVLAVEALLRRAKRAVKQHPAVFAIAKRLRALKVWPRGKSRG